MTVPAQRSIVQRREGGPRTKRLRPSRHGSCTQGEGSRLIAVRLRGGHMIERPQQRQHEVLARQPFCMLARRRPAARPVGSGPRHAA